VFHPFQGHALLEALEASWSEQLPSTPVVSWPRLSEPPPGSENGGPTPVIATKMEENGGIMLINCHSPSELRVVSQQECQTKSGSSMFKPFINGWVWNRAGNHSFCPQNIGVSLCIQTEFYYMLFILPPNIWNTPVETQELGSPLCHWGAVPLGQWGYIIKKIPRYGGWLL
jgi:hypothetical protein